MAFVAGDIGGTKTALAMYTDVGDPHQPYIEATFPSDEYPSFITGGVSAVTPGTYDVQLELRLSFYFFCAGTTISPRVPDSNFKHSVKEKG